MTNLDFWTTEEAELPEAFSLEEFKPSNPDYKTQLVRAEILPHKIASELLPYVDQIGEALDSVVHQELGTERQNQTFLPITQRRLEDLTALSFELPPLDFVEIKEETKIFQGDRIDREIRSVGQNSNRQSLRTEVDITTTSNVSWVDVRQNFFYGTKGKNQFRTTYTQLQLREHCLVLSTGLGTPWDTYFSLLFIPKGVTPMTALNELHYGLLEEVNVQLPGIYSEQRNLRIHANTPHMEEAWQQVAQVSGDNKVNGAEGILFLREPRRLTSRRSRDYIPEVREADAEWQKIRQQYRARFIR